MDERDVRVFSLNVYGLYGFSPKRRERLNALTQFLRSESNNYDLVLLQEVWTKEDYLRLREGLILEEGGPFGYSHYFDNGIIGTGTCVFSRSRLRFTNFHSFGLNGYPHYVHHGDWFAAKGLGLAVLEIDGFDVHVYISHYHAEYADIYDGHQLVHAMESAQWIKMTSTSADLTIYAGDFNTEPKSLPCSLLKTVGGLRDSWEEVQGSGNEGGGYTCETPYNSFTPESVTRSFPDGKRIDYIMFTSGVESECKAREVILPLPKRVPGQKYSYSDHEALEATIRVTRKVDQAGQLKRSFRLQNQPQNKDVLSEALKVVQKNEKRVYSNGIKYLITATALLALLLASHIPSFIESYSNLDLVLFLPRLLVSIVLSFYFIMGTIFTWKELNELLSIKASLHVLLDSDKI